MITISCLENPEKSRELKEGTVSKLAVRESYKSKKIVRWCGSLSSSGGASAAKEPSHFKVRTSSSQVTRMHFFTTFLIVTVKSKVRQCR